MLSKEGLIQASAPLTGNKSSPTPGNGSSPSSSPIGSAKGSKSGLPAGAIAGIALAATLSGLAIAVTIRWAWRQKRQRIAQVDKPDDENSQKAATHPPLVVSEMEGSEYPNEIFGGDEAFEIGDEGPRSELEERRAK